MASQSSASGRVFVSSTVYDLIDVRAELSATLRGVGLNPILSDQPDSEFVNPGDRNAIETCLVNLRASERCVLVLSQRYGGSLKDAGYPDISATHLEYRECRKEHLPVTMYVRDRLFAEYELWKQNKKKLRPKWTSEADAPRLFGLIDEHAPLKRSKVPNWVTPFSSSVDLCERVIRDLGSTASTAAIRMFAAQGRLPEFVIQSDGSTSTTNLWNCGKVPAFEVLAIDAMGEVAGSFDVVGPGASKPLVIRYEKSWLSFSGQHLPAIRVAYRIPSGETICDVFALTFFGTDDVRPVLAGRYYAGSAMSLSAPELTKVGGFWVVPRDPVNAAYDLSAKFKPNP